MVNTYDFQKEGTNSYKMFNIFSRKIVYGMAIMLATHFGSIRGGLIAILLISIFSYFWGD